jgi:hypothetical protein
VFVQRHAVVAGILRTLAMNEFPRGLVMRVVV